LVREVLSRLRPELDQARCEAIVRIRPQVLGSWDRSRLDQLITNLIVNAAKFGAGRPIEIEVGEQHGKAYVSVRDHGIGIPPEQQAHIFERFGRAVSATHYGGLGLGLYICRKIVEQHGGSIAVKSELGLGAVFIAELPSALEQDGHVRGANAGPPGGRAVAAEGKRVA
ncbi:MAG TPA: HAMP domain-containing sensor histidine kinase, partial [Polyangiaceae bacterium]